MIGAGALLAADRWLTHDANATSASCLAPGIGLFTHHKYQKAISASGEHGGDAHHVDAHGRSIRLPSDADGFGGTDGDESVPLTALDGRSPRADEESGPAPAGGFLGGLFKVRSCLPQSFSSSLPASVSTDAPSLLPPACASQPGASRSRTPMRLYRRRQGATSRRRRRQVCQGPPGHRERLRVAPRGRSWIRPTRGAKAERVDTRARKGTSWAGFRRRRY
jgi:hypothetical protein